MSRPLSLRNRLLSFAAAVKPSSLTKAPSRLNLFCALLMACAASSHADTVVLKDGEKIEGTITHESEVEVVISVSISSSIKDDRAISRSEIESISKISADEKDYEPIKHYKPGSESHTIGGYDTLTGAIEQFIGKYPESQFATELKENLYLLRAEKTRVSNGELKWNERWFNVSEAQAVQYQYDAQKLYSQMRVRAGRGDLIGALNTFEEIEKKFDGSTAFPDAVELAIAVIPKAASEVDRLAPIFKRQQEQFKEGIDLVAEPEKTRLIAANNATIAAAEAAVNAAERAGSKWKPLAPLSERANTAIKTMAGTEFTRLKALPVENMRQSIALNDKIEKSITDGKLPEAEAEIKRAQELWKENQRLEPLLAQLKVIQERNAAKLEAEKTGERAEACRPAPPGRHRSTAGRPGQSESCCRSQKEIVKSDSAPLSSPSARRTKVEQRGFSYPLRHPRPHFKRLPRQGAESKRNKRTWPNARRRLEKSTESLSNRAMTPRSATVERNTEETRISLSLSIDGKGKSSIATKIPFFDHMLTLFAKHGLLDLEVNADGDIEVDFHHTVEDVGISLGMAFAKALGTKRGIKRYGHAYVPMDETLTRAVIDFSGRPFLEYRVPARVDAIGLFPFQLVEEFMRGFAVHAGVNLHIEVLYGRDAHHMAESIFKALAKAVDAACQHDPRVEGIPSTKGVL